MSDELDPKQLLQNRDALGEIARHQWIESEKAGRDIGFETASEDWLKRFSKAWMDYHMPQQRIKAAKSAEPPDTKAKSRKAKSYF